MKKITITEKRNNEFNDLADEIFNDIFSTISEKMGVEDILSPPSIVDTALLREGFIKLNISFVEEFVSSHAETYLEKIIGIAGAKDLEELHRKYTEEEFEKDLACFFLRRFMYNFMNRIIVPENWDTITYLFEKIKFVLLQGIVIFKEEEKV